MRGRDTGPDPDGRYVEHPDTFLAGSTDGGFALRAAGRPTIRVAPAGDGWSVNGVEGREGWTLQRADARTGGFVLRGSEGEAGRTMPLVGTDWTAGLRFLMLDDGRLFRIVGRGARETGLDLLGWEMPGAYLRARPEPEGWRLKASAASSALPEIDVLVILFAAEILDAERGCVKP